MTSKGTPGPWMAHPNFPSLIVNGPDEHGRLVARTDVRSFVEDEAACSAENMANARLIAAAPVMATALLDCIAALERNHPDAAERRQAAAINARAAIAKATGASDDH